MRGLPYVYILLFFSRDINFKEADVIDQYIRAKMLLIEEDPDNSINDLVKKYIIYGPCGNRFPDSPYMKVDKRTGKKVCLKGFPKPFCDTTSVDKDNFARYRRRDNITWTKKVGT